MIKTLYNKIGKQTVASFPQVFFDGRIETIVSEKEADKAVDFLLTNRVLGVDTETRPCFHKGGTHKVSLLQVSTQYVCFLFRLCQIDLPTSVLRLLSNTTVPMVGLSWKDDLCALRRRKAFEPGRFIDIQDIIGTIGIEDRSLQKVYANIFHKRISKRQRLTNWDADILSDKQKLYAATDAWACLKLYEEIVRLQETHDYTLIMQEEPVDSSSNEIEYV